MVFTITEHGNKNALSTQLWQLAESSFTYHHMEGALGDVLSSKSDGNNIFSRFRGGVVNVKGPITIFHHIHVQLHPLWGLHLTGHFAFPSSFGVHCDNSILGGLQLLQTCC